jgi:hypothetical protein
MSRNDELQRTRERVNRVIELAREVEPFEAKSDLACFACVLTSGMIEVACRHYLGRYAERRASPEIVNYIQKKLYRFQNPRTEEIDALLRGFTSTIADDFSAAIGNEGKDAIDSVVNNKNQLAHGKGAGLGLDTMERYLKDVLKAIDSLRDILTE